MCDQLDGRGCEVVDELNLVITNLEMTIADLKKDIVSDLKGINFSMKRGTQYINIDGTVEKWESK